MNRLVKKISVSFALLSIISGGAYAAKTASLEVLQGKVQTLRSGQSAWEDVDPRGSAVLNQGDRVRTSNKAKAQIVMEDGSRIVLQPSTVFMVDFLEENSFRFKLDFGRLKALVSKFKSRNFSVVTPTAVCAVRGTEFDVSVDETSRQTSVFVSDGLVAVADSKGNEALLKAGDSISVTLEGLEAKGKPAEESKKEDKSKDDKTKDEVAREVRLDMSREAVEAAAALEMKNAVAQDGKTLIDAFGQRVRAESYIVRPESDRISWVVLNTRDNSFNHSRWDIWTNKAAPEVLSGNFLAGLYGKSGAGAPEYWAVKDQWYMSNTNDYWIEANYGGNPVKFSYTTQAGKTTNWWETIFDHHYVAISDAGKTLLLTHQVPASGVKGTLLAGTSGDKSAVYGCSPAGGGANCLADTTSQGTDPYDYFYDLYESNDALSIIGDQNAAAGHLAGAIDVDAINTAFSGQEGYNRFAEEKYFISGKAATIEEANANLAGLDIHFKTEISYCADAAHAGCSVSLAKTSGNSDLKITYDDYVIDDDGKAFTIGDVQKIFNVSSADSTAWKKFAERANYEYVTYSPTYATKIDLVIPMRILNQLGSGSDNRPSS
ncbi:MAG: FecR domain-containing protein [Elusimicrobia bacterium]|nr:FecR domain-containing protein [Elusimicrobiota bacterium]